MTVRPGARLAPILESVRRRAAVRRAALPLDLLRALARPAEGRRDAFVSALDAPGLSFIAECKRRSPSAGDLAADVDLRQRAERYAAGGAAAISVLTEQDHFAGAPEDLPRVAAAGLPVLRKDFVLDEGMVLESLLWDASAVLLLAVALEPRQLVDLADLAREVGLATLVEVHDERELEAAADATPDAIGVNARDLRTFEVRLDTVERLLPRVPPGPVPVAESGLHSLDDLRRVHAAGARAVLVGEALMRAEDPAATLSTWREACRHD